MVAWVCLGVRRSARDMADTPLPFWFGPFAARPRLVTAFGIGFAVLLSSRFLAGLQPTTSMILGWDVVCLSYISMMFWRMAGCTPEQMRAEAARDDEGRLTILTVVMVA